MKNGNQSKSPHVLVVIGTLAHMEGRSARRCIWWIICGSSRAAE